MYIHVDIVVKSEILSEAADSSFGGYFYTSYSLFGLHDLQVNERAREIKKRTPDRGLNSRPAGRSQITLSR